MPPLDEALAKKFGHDGMGLQFNPRYKERQDIPQSVRVGKDGLLEFVEGFSEAAIIKGKAEGLPEASGLGHEARPVISQAVEVVGGGTQTTEVEIFYGTEHPHEYGSQQLGQTAHSLMRKGASGITKGNGDVEEGSLVRKMNGKAQRSAPPPQRRFECTFLLASLVCLMFCVIPILIPVLVVASAQPPHAVPPPGAGGYGRPPSNPTSYPSSAHYSGRPFQYSSYRGESRLPARSRASDLLGNLHEAQTISSPTHSITIDMASLPSNSSNGAQSQRLWSDRYI